jgi:hypothetical protein
MIPLPKIKVKGFTLMSKKIIFILSITMLLSVTTLSSKSLILQPITPTWGVTDIDWIGEIRYNHASEPITFIHKSADFKRLLKRAQRIYSIKKNLRLKLRQAIQKKVEGKRRLNHFHFSLDSPIQLDLKRHSDTRLNFRLGGFKIASSGELESDYSFYSTEYQINSTPLWITGEYHLNSGTIKNIHIIKAFTLTIDIDGFSEFMLGLNEVFINDLTIDVKKIVKKWAAEQLIWKDETSLLGLYDESIPENIIHDGHNFSDDFKNALQTLEEDEKVMITVMNDVKGGLHPHSSSVLIKIKVANRLSLDVWSESKNGQKK